MIFVDTWAWVALACKRDAFHRQVRAEHKRLQRAGRHYVTSNFVLSELIAHLYTTLTPTQAQGFIATLLSAVDSGSYQLVHTSSDQFRSAWAMRQKFHDKPDISFVDFTSMVIMRDFAITEVFTGDAHFHHVNLGFQLVP